MSRRRSVEPAAVRQAVEVLTARFGRPPRIVDMAAHLRVSRRTALRYLFDALGDAPCPHCDGTGRVRAKQGS